MKKIWIKILIILGIVLIAVLTPIILAYTKVSAVEISIDYPDNSVIISRDSIVNDLHTKYGDFTTYMRKDVDEDGIRDFLEKQDFVKKAVVNISSTGILRISVFQRLAIARVYNKKNQQYYIDDEMNVINSQNSTQIPYCLMVTGNILDRPYGKIDTAKYRDAAIIYHLAMMVNKDKVLKQWIGGIDKKNKRWYLLPSQGDYTITLGDSSDWQNELIKLHYLYSDSFSKNGWADYDNIDLRFYNQAVCSKRDKAKEQ